MCVLGPSKDYFHGSQNPKLSPWPQPTHLRGFKVILFVYYRCVLNWLDVFKRNIKPSLFQSQVGKMSVLLLFESTDHNRVVKMSKYRKLSPLLLSDSFSTCRTAVRRCHVSSLFGVDAQSGGALLGFQKPCCCWDAQLWLRAANSGGHYTFLPPPLGTSVHTEELTVRAEREVLCLCVFFSAAASSRTRTLHLHTAEAHCLWRSATVRCPITHRALRRRRHRALLCGAEIARREPRRGRAEKSLQRDGGRKTDGV